MWCVFIQFINEFGDYTVQTKLKSDLYDIINYIGIACYLRVRWLLRNKLGENSKTFMALTEHSHGKMESIRHEIT